MSGCVRVSRFSTVSAFVFTYKPSTFVSLPNHLPETCRNYKHLESLEILKIESKGQDHRAISKSSLNYTIAVLARAQPYREGETQNHHGVPESTAPNHDLAMESMDFGGISVGFSWDFAGFSHGFQHGFQHKKRVSSCPSSGTARCFCSFWSQNSCD